MIETDIDREISAIRAAHAARFNDDLDAIVADLRSREGSDGRQVVSPPPRRPENQTPPQSTPELPAQPEPEMSR